MKNTECYQAIHEFYGDQKAKRSQVPYINHIYEGLQVLERLNAPELAKEGFCLHPIVQSDEAIKQFVAGAGTTSAHELLKKHRVPYTAVALAVEYRLAANSYLSHGKPADYRPSVFEEVRLMLIADKVQNYKDFMQHHFRKHERSDELHDYFLSWPKLLNLDFALFGELVCQLRDRV